MKMRHSFYSIACFWIAIAVLIVSGAVIVGWLTQNLVLIQIRSSFAPMRFNTAINLFLIALMQLALLRQDRKLARILSVVVSITSLAVVSQYLTGTPLGIDEFFTRAYVSVHSIYPGRISPNTALSLYVLAFAGLVLSFQEKPRHLLISGFLGAVAFCFGALSLIGYLIDVHVSFAWGSYSHMALHTAVCVIVLGISTFLRSYELALKSKTPEAYEPMAVAAIFLCVTVGFWQAFIERDASRVRQIGAAQGTVLVEQLDRTLNDQYLSMIRRAHRLVWDATPSEREWHEDAAMFLKHYPEIRYLAVLTPGGQTKWSYPGKESYHFEPELFHTINSEERSSITPIIRINSNEWGFVIRVAELISVFSAESLIHHTIRIQGYEYRVVEAKTGRQIYSTIRKTAEIEGEWGSQVDLKSDLLDWKITVVPTYQTLEERASILPIVVILTGLIISFLFMSLVHFGMSARRREKERQMSEAFLETILAHLPVILFCKQIKNEFRYSIWNKTAESILELKGSEVVGKTDYEIFPKEQADEFRRNDLAAIEAKGEMTSPEETVSCPSGKVAIVRSRKLVVYDEVGEPLLLLGISEDITQQKINQEIIEAQRLQMVNTAKMTALGEMAGGIAHEINNPLAIIEIYASQLTAMSENQQLDSDRVSKAASVISSTVDRIARITRGLRSFARDAEDDPFVLANVKRILNETMEFCQEKFLKNGIRLIMDQIPQDLEVECKSVQISQVLLNLLNNAFDAVVNTRDAWVKIEAKRDGEKVIIAVVDSGHGIPEDVAEKIMQPFFTTKAVGKGTGLGLSISQGIIQNHHGELYLDADSKNTRFVIAIPKQQSKNNG